MSDDQHRRDEQRADERQQEIMDKPLTLTTTHKVLAVLLLVVSICGNWLVNRATTELRIVDLEKRVARNVETIARMETHGFGGHETRINRLETKTDDQQKSISEMKAKLDVAVAILERIERQVSK